MKMKNLLLTIALVSAACLKAQVPVANFSVTSPACSGTTLQITDLSSNSPTAWSYTMTGGAPATSTVQNPGVLYFAPGTYSITLVATNGNGSSAPVTKTVSVIMGANFFINPATKTMCFGNGPLSFTAATGGPGPVLTYSWNTGATTPSVSVNPSVTTVYTCVATATNGCQSSRSATAVVNPLPTVTITSNPTSICAGATATLTALSSGPAPNTYTWSTSATTSVITSSLTGVYNVTVTNSQGCRGSKTYSLNSAAGATLVATANPTALCSGSSATLSVTGASSYTWSTGGTTPNIVVTPTTTTTYTVRGVTGACTGTTSLILTVNSTPTIVATSSSPSICIGNSVTLMASGASSYTWNPGALSGSSVVVSPTVTTTYTVTGTNGTCSGTRTISIGVNAGPAVNAVANPSLVCSGGNSTLTATGAVTYTWNTGATTAVIVVTPTTNTTYTVTGSNALGCTRTRTVSIVISTPSVNAVANPTAICSGNSATLVASGATSYTWNTGATTAVTVVSPTTTTSYTVTGTNPMGCTASKTVAVIVNTPPSINAVSSPSTGICAGNSATLSASGATSYTWIPGGLTGSVVVVSPTVSTTYTVNGINACGFNTKSVSVMVNPKPFIFAFTTSTMICVGQSAILSTSSTAVSYSWSTGSTSYSASVSPTVTTTYTVTGFSAAGCFSTTTVTQSVSACLGIEQAAASANSFVVYPNPSNGEFNLSLANVTNGMSLEIYNSIGQVMYRTPIKDAVVKINLTALPDGIYHIRIIADNKQVYKTKVIKD